MCDECGETSGTIQQVEIAWPGTENFKFYMRIIRDDGETEFMPNPATNGRVASLWLHPHCEQAALERLEKTRS
jgi:hypothetical protein